MKKRLILACAMILLSTGCFKNNKDLTCTITDTYDDIKTDWTIKTEFSKGKATRISGVAVMNFESAEAAQAYYDTYEDDKSSLTIENNKIIVASVENVEDGDDAGSRDVVKAYYENSGYSCK